MHTRRILWRNGDTNKPPKTYGFLRVTFGDKSAGAIATTAVRETARIYNHLDPVAATKIEDDTYMDDLSTGADTKEEIAFLKSSIKNIFSKGNFDVKGS